MNKLEIEIPQGKEIDWQESARQEKIVFKKKQLTYEDVCKALFKDGHWFINNLGVPNSLSHIAYDSNAATTKHQLECILAKNKLANIARYLNGNWKCSPNDRGWVIGHNAALDHNIIVKVEHYTDLSNVIFKTHALAEEAIQIIGEETIKLALEPLY